MFRIFITKHVIGTYGINTYLSKIGSTKYKNLCPSCHGSSEMTSHIVKCPYADRSELFQAMVDNLMELTQKNDTGPGTATLVKDYL